VTVKGDEEEKAVRVTVVVVVVVVHFLIEADVRRTKSYPCSQMAKFSQAEET
jgi:hypothetical protein